MKKTKNAYFLLMLLLVMSAPFPVFGQTDAEAEPADTPPVPNRASEEAVSNVAPVMATWFPGRSVIAPADEPLSRDNWEGLRTEYEAILASMTTLDKVSHSLANLGMYVALYVLCGVYVFFHERRTGGVYPLRALSSSVNNHGSGFNSCSILPRDKESRIRKVNRFSVSGCHDGT